MNMIDEKCLFCQIGAKNELAEVVWENEEFIAIANKYPMARIHLLVMPKAHVSKNDLASVPLATQLGGRARVTDEDFWSRIMGAVFEVVRLKGLDKTGYKLVNNGAGYNHFDHEHIHVLGGSKGEPAGKT